MLAAILVMCPWTSVDAIDRAIDRSIDRSDAVIDTVLRVDYKSQIFQELSPVTSSDENLNILTICFRLIFTSSGTGCSGFTSI